MAITKDFTAAVKAAGADDGLGEGQFTALVSVFGNVDRYGEVVVAGAFTETLKAWEESGDPIPVVWSHDWMNPFSHIGAVTKAEETDDGLQVTAQLDLDNPTAAQIFRLMKGRRIKEFSFAYDVLDSAEATVDGQYVYELRKLALKEVGPCLSGVNQETELIAVKASQMAAGAKAGRVLSQKNLDQLVSARDALTTVIEAATPSDDEEPKASAPKGVVETDEPSQASEPVVDEPDGAKSAAEPSAPRRALAVAHITNL